MNTSEWPRPGVHGAVIAADAPGPDIAQARLALRDVNELPKRPETAADEG